MVGIDIADENPARLTIAGALGWGFVTAMATGPFAMLLFAVFLVASDPTELAEDPLAMLGALGSMLVFGSLIAVVFAVIVGWLPIALLGWSTAKAAGRWPILHHRAIWAGVGAVAGSLCVALVGGTIDDVIKDPELANWERLRDMLVFGGGCGIFAALFFRWLITPARGSP